MCVIVNKIKIEFMSEDSYSLTFAKDHLLWLDTDKPRGDPFCHTSDWVNAAAKMTTGWANELILVTALSRWDLTALRKQTSNEDSTAKRDNETELEKNETKARCLDLKKKVKNTKE